jgi:ethanolamine utilization protein EutQ
LRLAFINPFKYFSGEMKHEIQAAGHQGQAAFHECRRRSRLAGRHLRIFVSALSSANNKDKPLCAGFFHLEAGKPLDYTYDYEEMKIVVDGEFNITEVNTGKKYNAKVGDVLYFSDGDRIIFETPHHAVGFFCGQRQPL